MSVYSAEYHAMIFSPSPPPAAPRNADAAPVTADKTADQDEGFFHHILDVINPLQHLPVIGTIYRAITHEHIGPVEKIAGDALYGGLWGAVASVADVAFEGITGKSFEDTAMSWIRGDDSIRVASARVTAPSITPDTSLPSSDLPSLPGGANAVASNMPFGLDTTALTNSVANSLSAKGVDGDIASRALYAYRRSMGMAAPVPVFASIN